MNILRNGFPTTQNIDYKKILSIIPIHTFNNVQISECELNIYYILNGDKINFPYRMYNLDVDENDLLTLNQTEQNIVHCIYSRSSNGYVREKHLKALLSTDFESFAIPFIFKICDEYIVELLEIIYETLKDRDNKDFQEFCLENQKSFCVSHSRMISYWDLFYSGRYYDKTEKIYPKYKNYIGRKLFKEIFGYTRSLEKNKDMSF